MNLVELLIDTAVEDNQLLTKNQELGDRPDVFRDVEFVFYAKNEEQARLVANFVADFRYGQPIVRRVDDHGQVLWQLLVTIHAPTTENVLMPISAFMACLSRLYDLEYDGWSSTIHR